jgi:hypothetical protein
MASSSRHGVGELKYSSISFTSIEGISLGDFGSRRNRLRVGFHVPNCRKSGLAHANLVRLKVTQAM